MMLGFAVVVDCAAALNASSIMSRKNGNVIGFML
jgi:hypothetical protein